MALRAEEGNWRVIGKAAKRLYHCFPSPPSTNLYLRPGAANPYDYLPTDAVLLDIGSKDNRANYAFGLPGSDMTLICTDLYPGPNVDVVANAEDLSMLKESVFDGAFLVGLLQAVPHPNRVVDEVYRVLKPGGIVYASVPFLSPYSEDPTDYYRWTFSGLEIVFSKFETVKSGFNRGPASTFVHVLVEFLSTLFSFGSVFLYGMLRDFFQWGLFWLKYLDIILRHFPSSNVIHSGSFFLGRKGT